MRHRPLPPGGDLRRERGAVTTFAVLAGGTLDPTVVFVLGAANPFRDGLSTGMSNLLSRRSEEDYRTVRGETTGEHAKSPPSTAPVTFAVGTAAVTVASAVGAFLGSVP